MENEKTNISAEEAEMEQEVRPFILPVDLSNYSLKIFKGEIPFKIEYALAYPVDDKAKGYKLLLKDKKYNMIVQWVQDGTIECGLLDSEDVHTGYGFIYPSEESFKRDWDFSEKLNNKKEANDE